jgi:hypothetical protein
MRKPRRGRVPSEEGGRWSSIMHFVDLRIRPPAHSRCAMSSLFLTPEEVYERYRGAISLGTLRNWRMMKIGPSFLKLGRAVLYPLAELEAWDRKNLVICRVAKVPSRNEREAAG